MSKEKQCECCHEWWFDNNIKGNLCPNCYDYFKQLKQQLAEKDNEIEHLKINYFNLVRNIDKFADNQLAIQELEKVKNKIEKRNNGTNNANYSTQYKDGYSSCCCDIEDQINNQIKELKGEK